MSGSRRQFLAKSGALIFTTGVVSTSSEGIQPKILPNITEEKTIRYGMLHNENLCIGCNACVEACREVNLVPEGVTRLNILRSEPKGTFPNVEYRFIRQSCEHCDNAPCVMVCPTGAAYKDEVTAIIDVHDERCVGCGYCLAACPYQVRFFNPETQSADKCDFCKESRLSYGQEPACVESCPQKALTFGDLNDPDSDITKMIEQNPVYRDKVQLGTQPKLYKIPFLKGES